MKSLVSLICALFILASAALGAAAGPILKPAKYYGPIPKRSISLRIGFFGGATNGEMYGFLSDKRKDPSIQAFDDDFSNSIQLDGSYTVKLHPKLAVRANASIAFLRSESNGKSVPSVGTAPYPLRTFKRRFNVDLFSISGDALYFFTDASVNEFQPYVGGGFSAWIPHAVYKEDAVDEWSSPPSPSDSTVVRPTVKVTKWSMEAGIQGVVGAPYYVTNTFAFNMEARYHIAQSRFPLDVNVSATETRKINFLVDYTGFVLNVGVLKAF